VAGESSVEGPRLASSLGRSGGDRELASSLGGSAGDQELVQILTNTVIAL
jgi:hypothetical protein